MELRDRAGVARLANGASQADNAPHQCRQFGVAVQGAGHHGQRAQADDGHFLGVLPHQIDQQTVGGVGVMQLGAGKGNAAQSIGTVQACAIHVVFDRKGRTRPRPARGINQPQNGVDVGGRLVPGDVAGRRGQAQYIQVGIVQGQANGHGAVNTGIGHENDF